MKINYYKNHKILYIQFSDAEIPYAKKRGTRITLLTDFKNISKTTSVAIYLGKVKKIAAIFPDECDPKCPYYSERDMSIDDCEFTCKLLNLSVRGDDYMRVWPICPKGRKVKRQMRVGSIVKNEN